MRLLVVEDETLIADSIKKGLENHKYAVDVAYRGDDGFDLASTEDYDLIILDLMLPGLDGITFCKQLREKKIHTPILMLTAKSQLQDKVLGLDCGADDYLTKPFEFEELVARVRALVRRPSNFFHANLQVGSLQLDTGNFELIFKGKKIPLSNKEFSLMEYLMRNAGKIISKEQIIAHVWNFDADVLPNTVEVYIKNLRTKIGDGIIKTKRGFGYGV